MIKMLFFKSEELEELLSTAMNKLFNTETTCKIDVIDDEDMALIYDGDKELGQFKLNSILSTIGNETKENIVRYDVGELCDYGDGFIFYIT